MKTKICTIIALWLMLIIQGAHYTNPILATNFPDPCILASSNGNYYVYATNTGNIHFQVSESSNGVDFEYKGDAMPILPEWAKGSTENWAPHVIEVDNIYYMYFAAEPIDRNGTKKCIGVAKSNNPLGPFQDASLNNEPLICHELDPMVLYSPNSIYIYYSSASTLKVQTLAYNLVSLAKDSKEEIMLYSNSSLDYQNLIEASWIHYRNGYYYYYFSGDNCCGDSAHYSVMIARSKQATGPFYKKSYYYSQNSSDVDVVIHLNNYFNATGHMSLLTDKNGDDWMYYHAYKIGEEAKGRMLLIDRIYYDDQDWPYINTTSPSYTQKTGPLL